MKPCPKCGEPLIKTDELFYCASCGAKFKRKKSEKQEAAVMPEKPVSPESVAPATPPVDDTWGQDFDGSEKQNATVETAPRKRPAPKQKAPGPREETAQKPRKQPAARQGEQTKRPSGKKSKNGAAKPRNEGWDDGHSATMQETEKESPKKESKGLITGLIILIAVIFIGIISVSVILLGRLGVIDKAKGLIGANKTEYAVEEEYDSQDEPAGFGEQELSYDFEDGGAMAPQ